MSKNFVVREVKKEGPEISGEKFEKAEPEIKKSEEKERIKIEETRVDLFQA